MSKRKPGEPIYLRSHMLALMTAVAAPIVIPRVFELMLGPIGLTARMVAGVAIAAVAGVLLYRIYGPSARNEP